MMSVDASCVLVGDATVTSVTGVSSVKFTAANRFVLSSSLSSLTSFDTAAANTGAADAETGVTRLLNFRISTSSPSGRLITIAALVRLEGVGVGQDAVGVGSVGTKGCASACSFD